MLGRALDSLISIVSPAAGARRVASRMMIDRLKATASQHRSMNEMLGGRRAGGYEAGKTDRLKSGQIGSTHENDVPREQIIRLRWRSWNLYRNNPQARKICRTLGAKVIGRGQAPQPQSATTDGQPFVEFRRRARQVWDEFTKEADYRGKPGRGGHHFTSLSKTALRHSILSGGVLYRFHHLNKGEQKTLGLHVPLQVQLLNVDRLDESKNDDSTFFGIGVGKDSRVTGYWILNASNISSLTRESTFVPAAQMGHLFAEEDIDQLLGSSWFGAALLTMDDRRNYEYSELVAAEMASCIVGTYSSGSGASLGLPNPDGNQELTDGNGNPVTHLEPGLFLNTGSTGKVEIVSSNRPTSASGDFLGHLVRSEAVSVPGVKSSTLTGDYRNSSFSSERSADNDVWPEIEETQDWFSAGFCQPIYEEVITTAVLAGMFDDIKGFTVADFKERRREYLKTNWQGPVPRSINPRDDAEAARERVKNANSTPQIESAKEGRDWRENIDGIAEFIDYCRERGLPDSIWQQALGIPQKDAPGSGQTDPAVSRPSEQQLDEEAAAARFRATQAGFSIQNSAGR